MRGGPNPTTTASERVTLLPFCRFWYLLDPSVSQMRSLVCITNSHATPLGVHSIESTQLRLGCVA